MNYGGSLYFSEVVVVGEKENVKLGFWQCLHVHGELIKLIKLIKSPIRQKLAGRSKEKKRTSSRNVELKR